MLSLLCLQSQGNHSRIRESHSKDKAKAEAKSKADLDRVRIESAEELKHVLESAALQHKQQQDVILTLQVSTPL
jgi:translation initiation factor 2B subunit (eIF-2B alpha/beta/delta family)